VGYGLSKDPYCYPGTTVLINRPGIRDPAELQEFETARYLRRAESGLPSGSLDKRHYLALHHHCFQDVYA